MDNRKKVSISAALIVMVCFFLPWVHVSCGAARDSISGMDLARDGQSGLWLIPLLTLAAVLARFTKSWRGKLDLGALFGFLTGLITTYLMNRERMRADDTSGLLQVRVTVWFWIGLVSSIVLTVSSAVHFLKRPRLS